MVQAGTNDVQVQIIPAVGPGYTTTVPVGMMMPISWSYNSFGTSCIIRVTNVPGGSALFPDNIYIYAVNCIAHIPVTITTIYVTQADVILTTTTTTTLCDSVDADDYRFGFNGKEKDNEVNGIGNLYDYGFRIYNSRLGRFLSTDPLAPDYPWLSSYQFASLNPIYNIDVDGLEGASNVFYGEVAKLEKEWNQFWWEVEQDWNDFWSFSSTEPVISKTNNRELDKKVIENTNVTNTLPAKSDQPADAKTTGTSAVKTISVADKVKFYGYRKSDKVGCFRRSVEMINSAGYKTVPPDNSRVIQMTKANKDGVLEVQKDVKKGLEMIDKHLEESKPIIVGTDWKAGDTGNHDKTTDHWIVIVGKGEDKNGVYYNYFDPQTSQNAVGTNSGNKLYIQKDGTLKGDYRTGTDYERTYTVTMVRPSDKKD